MTRRTQGYAAALLALLVVALHGVRLLAAGGLWRDEAAAARLATLPTLREVYDLFPHEAFPLLFPFTLRAYSGLTGGGDFALRAFGCGVGLLIVALLWRNARLTGRAAPLLSLALLGLDLPFLTYGDSIRGYGLGSALVLLLYGLLARALAAPSRGPRAALARLLPAALAAIACVQVLLSNAALVLALTAAAAAVALRNGRRRFAAGLLGCGLLAALSLLPYAPSLAAARRQWSLIVVYPVSLSRLFQGFTATLGWLPVRLVWLLLVAVGLWGFQRARRHARQRAALARQGDSDALPEREAPAHFAALAIPAALLANGLFLAVLSYTPRPWYFLPLLALLASALDTLFGHLSRAGERRLALLEGAAVCLLLAAQAVPLAQGLPLRQTNVDLVAQQIARSAAPADLVVVDPWFCGVSFNRYYRGAAPWLTLPDLPDHRIHRYDLLKPRLAAERPIDDVLGRVAETLRAHHRVWLVDGTTWPWPSEPIRLPPPAPHSPEGWHDKPYVYAWSLELGAFLKDHAVRAASLAVPGGEANRFEDLSLVVAQGWRDGEATDAVPQRIRAAG